MSTPDGAPDQFGDTITNQTVEDYFATARFSNWNSRVVINEGDTIVEGGYTVIINGTLYVDYIVGPNGTSCDCGLITEKTFLTDVRIFQDGSDWKLQKKTQRVKVLEAADESDWTDVYTFQTCSQVVQTVTWDDATSTKKIIQTVIPDVVVVRLGTPSTETVLTASNLTTVVTDSDYDGAAADTFRNSYRQDVYVLAYGAAGSDDVFVTEEC